MLSYTERLIKHFVNVPERGEGYRALNTRIQPADHKTSNFVCSSAQHAYDVPVMLNVVGLQLRIFSVVSSQQAKSSYTRTERCRHATASNSQPKAS
jgi:hypothetical protein